MKNTNPFPRDYSDPLEVALLLCKAADLPNSEHRSAVVLAVTSYLMHRGAIGGDYHQLSAVTSLLESKFIQMPTKAFEAALYLHVRASAGRSSKLGPAHLVKLTEEQLVNYVLTLRLPRMAKRATRKR